MNYLIKYDRKSCILSYLRKLLQCCLILCLLYVSSSAELLILGINVELKDKNINISVSEKKTPHVSCSNLLDTFDFFTLCQIE